MARARNWRDVRADAVEKGHVTEADVAVARRNHEEQIRAYRLRQIREAQLARQGDVAGAMGVTQSRVSRIENGDIDHVELATLRAYVESLGGHLEVVAEFGDERLVVG